MSEEDIIAEAQLLSRWQQHKFMLLVGATITMAFVLVVIALMLYNSSGAAQLDLSRPGYQSVRDKVSRDNSFAGFPSSGSIDKEALDEFREMYDKQLKEATVVESFGGDVLSDASLGVDAPVPSQ